MVARAKIIATAREYLGTPYHHVGRLKGVGVDCIGLIWCVGRELQIPDAQHDLRSYSRRPDGVTLEREFTKAMDRIALADAIVGDILLFWFHRPHLVTHAGIKTPVGVIHTHSGVGKVVEHHLDEAWTKRLAGAFRFRGVESFYTEPAVDFTSTFVPPQRPKLCLNCGD